MWTAVRERYSITDLTYDSCASGCGAGAIESGGALCGDIVSMSRELRYGDSGDRNISAGLTIACLRQKCVRATRAQKTQAIQKIFLAFPCVSCHNNARFPKSNFRYCGSVGLDGFSNFPGRLFCSSDWTILTISHQAQCWIDSGTFYAQEFLCHPFPSPLGAWSKDDMKGSICDRTRCGEVV